jgi:phenylacetate-CoA ligase
MEDARDREKNLVAERKDQLRLKTNLRYEIEMHDYGVLPRYQVKARRLIDLRNKH